MIFDRLIARQEKNQEFLSRAFYPRAFLSRVTL